MASTQRSGSMLLALMILYWTTSSVKSDLPYEARDRAEKILEHVKSDLSLFQTAVEIADKTKTLTGMMKNLANFAALAPGIGAVLSSAINIILVFIPEDNPVLNEVKKGFAEVNRKLDSLSVQITNLATDVEWYNYVSIYSQDEVCILGTWKKFDEFFKNHRSNNFNYLAESFVNYYEYTKTEACVANLYHYLTVRDQSLSKNINDMLIRKFQCSSEVGKYNFYLTSLLLKGTVLNKVYWKLTDFNAAHKDAEHAQMFKNVFENQLAALQVCETKYEEYASNTVKEMAKSLNADNKLEFAKQVKQELDKKLSWYNWVVLVYDKSEEKAGNIKVFSVSKISSGDFIVALENTLKEDMHHSSMVYYSEKCFNEGEPCQLPCSGSHEQDPMGTLHHLESFSKIPYATYKEGLVTVVPEPSYQRTCMLDGYNYKLSLYDSGRLTPCQSHPCKNEGECKELMKTNDWLCVCPTGYSGDECENTVDTTLTENAQTLFPLSVIKSTSQKLKSMESKLDKIITLMTPQD
uniref:uncharacterized protein LOC124066417 n=1 Tax=Scatophagus argus TaxID=75038 RepID=UPI001ED80430|nr:uncharacterized protein LOC124066417 [Scatophagus argus]